MDRCRRTRRAGGEMSRNLNAALRHLLAAVANEPGYYPVPLAWCHGKDFDQMVEHAEHLNQKIFKLNKMDCLKIVTSTMRGKARKAS